MGFSLANFLFVVGSLNNWFWSSGVVPHTELYRRILLIQISVAVVSIGLGGPAVAKERPRTVAVLALVIGWFSFFISGMSMAV
jgi:hypothetical protein